MRIVEKLEERAAPPAVTHIPRDLQISKALLGERQRMILTDRPRIMEIRRLRAHDLLEVSGKKGEGLLHMAILYRCCRRLDRTLVLIIPSRQETGPETRRGEAGELLIEIIRHKTHRFCGTIYRQKVEEGILLLLLVPSPPPALAR